MLARIHGPGHDSVLDALGTAVYTWGRLWPSSERMMIQLLYRLTEPKGRYEDDLPASNNLTRYSGVMT